jgi:cell division septation protein DedD
MVLQVAALRSEADALALAEALQQKQFPAFVLTPETGGLYRVQVGPYTSTKAADGAKKSLEREGFKSIVKH